MKVLDHHKAAGWRIRTGHPRDLAGIERVFTDCLEDFPWRGPIAAEIQRLRRTLIAANLFVAEEPMAGIVGFMTFESVNAYVPHLFVAQDWRFCGVASALLKIARNRAGRPIRLDVDCLNESAIDFYRELGWTIEAPADQRSGVIRQGQIRLVSPG